MPSSLARRRRWRRKLLDRRLGVSPLPSRPNGTSHCSYCCNGNVDFDWSRPHRYLRITCGSRRSRRGNEWARSPQTAHIPSKVGGHRTDTGLPVPLRSHRSGHRARPGAPAPPAHPGVARAHPLRRARGCRCGRGDGRRRSLALPGLASEPRPRRAHASAQLLATPDAVQMGLPLSVGPWRAITTPSRGGLNVNPIPQDRQYQRLWADSSGS